MEHVPYYDTVGTEFSLAQQLGSSCSSYSLARAHILDFRADLLRGIVVA